MRNVLEIIGIVLSIAIVLISDVITIIMYKSSGYYDKDDEFKSWKLYKQLAFNSAAGVSVLLLFTLIAQLF